MLRSRNSRASRKARSDRRAAAFQAKLRSNCRVVVLVEIETSPTLDKGSKTDVSSEPAVDPAPDLSNDPVEEDILDLGGDLSDFD